MVPSLRSTVKISFLLGFSKKISFFLLPFRLEHQIISRKEQGGPHLNEEEEAIENLR